jgi:hypothetical protein
LATNLSTLFSLFKAKFTALSNKFYSASFQLVFFDSQVASGKYFVWAVATKKDKLKERLAFYFHSFIYNLS